MPHAGISEKSYPKCHKYIACLVMVSAMKKILGKEVESAAVEGC